MNATTTKGLCIEARKWQIRAIRSGLRLQAIRARVRAQKERAA